MIRICLPFFLIVGIVRVAIVLLTCVDNLELIPQDNNSSSVAGWWVECPSQHPATEEDSPGDVISQLVIKALKYVADPTASSNHSTTKHKLALKALDC
jgi:hypothetical protein